MNAAIPANTTAEIVLRGASLAGLKEGGRPLDAADGILSASEDAGGVTLSVGSGVYAFEYEHEGLFRTRYTENTALSDLLNDDAAVEVLKRHFPQLFEGPMLQFLRTSNLKEVAENGMTRMASGQLDEVLSELSRL